MLKFRSIYVFIIIFFISVLNAQNEYKYTYVPKKVYENQIFGVTVVGDRKDTAVSLAFDTQGSNKALFKTPLEVKNANDIFYTFYFKAKKSDLKLPRLFITSANGELSLDPIYISIAKLEPKDNFSKVLATDMKIKNYQVSNFDTNSHIVTISIEAYEANMEDMGLDNIIESGIENLRRKNAQVTAEFYAVLPRKQKKLIFSYFNTAKKRYIDIEIPVNVEDASVTTQSDINPKVDAFDKLKRYALIIFSLFFIIMLIWKRDFFYLALMMLSIITLLTFYVPHKKICVRQGTPLYILPTQTSTVGARIEKRLDTMLLGERGDFKKVEYKKGIIGWIKNEDVCDN